MDNLRVLVLRGGEWREATDDEVGQWWSSRREWDGSLGPNHDMPAPPWRIVDTEGRVVQEALTAN